MKSSLGKLQRLWESSPIESLRQTLVGDLRQGLMFAAATVWLILLSQIIPFDLIDETSISMIWRYHWFQLFFWLTWALIICDSLMALILVPSPKPKRVWLAVLVNCLLPCTRLAIIPASPNYHAWIPFVGWTRENRAISQTLEFYVTPAMLGVTLLILPVLGAQLLRFVTEAGGRWYHWLLHYCMAIVWCAFSFELLFMMGIVRRPIDYIKKHWVNLVIITLPVMAFLRVFQLSKLISLAKYSRTFRLRGIMARAKNTILLFSIIERLIPSNPEKKLEKLLYKREDLDEARQILERQIAEAHLAVYAQKEKDLDTAAQESAPADELKE